MQSFGTVREDADICLAFVAQFGRAPWRRRSSQSIGVLSGMSSGEQMAHAKLRGGSQLESPDFLTSHCLELPVALS